jgi:acyl carrier protein
MGSWDGRQSPYSAAQRPDIRHGQEDPLTPVPERFMDIVKRHSKASEIVEFDPDASMKSLGLESGALVHLLISIEEEYSIEFPQELVRPAVFATPAALWGSLRDFLPKENGNVRDS